MTRMEAIRLAIEELEKQRRICSKNRQGLIPLDGMEEQFTRLDSAIHELKEICQALQAECVKRSIAVWQEKIMEEPEAIQTAMRDLMPAG